MHQLLAVVSRRRARTLALASIDIISALAALVLAVMLRMNGDVPPAMVDGMLTALPIVALVSAIVFHQAGLYNRVWRFVSTRDLPSLVIAATLSIMISTLVLAIIGAARWLPTSVPIIEWLILVAALTGVRVARRLQVENNRRRVDAASAAVSTSAPRRRAIVIGTDGALEIALRQIEADPARAFQPVAILDDTAGHLKLRVRGVPVMGGTEALEHVVMQLDAEGRRPDCIIMAETSASSDGLVGAKLMRLITDAETLGLSIAHQPGAKRKEATSGEVDMDFVDMTALLGRPPRIGDTASIARFVAHQRVMVTGAGGTIGRELVRQLAAAGPGELILVDANEFNLYSIDQELGENFPNIPRVPVMCSIRQRGTVMAAFAKYRPNLVFHAAALKHVPLVESNPCAGVQTNVLGTRNVADASRRFGVRAMIQVSTDKAVNPVGVMGATKRLGELYCQALDLDGENSPVAPRFLTVRFGNVLGSSGSLIPLFQRQLSRRAPLTVTHPEICRYFMTVHEAVHLILQGAAQALENNAHHGRIFVLDMGEPIRILDIAKRMIRLAGLEPDRDIKINIVGLRPGEKLYEELFDTSEKRLPSVLPGIMEAEPVAMSLPHLNAAFDRLAAATAIEDTIATRALLAEILRPATTTCVGYGETRRVATLVPPTAAPATAPSAAPAAVDWPADRQGVAA